MIQKITLEEVMKLALESSSLHGFEAKLLADEIVRFREEMTKANEIMDEQYKKNK